MRGPIARKAGFSLVEVTLALGVAAVSMLAIFGLMVTGTQTNHTAIEETLSADIISSVAADLRATPLTSPRGQAATSMQYGISIPANPVTGTPTTTMYFNAAAQPSAALDGSSRYRLVITFRPNGAARTATFAHLRMTWPARANPADAKTDAAETLIALDRN